MELVHEAVAGRDEQVTRYQYKQETPVEFKNLVGFLRVNDPCDSLTELLEKPGDSAVVQAFHGYVQHDRDQSTTWKLMALEVCHSVVHRDPDAARAALAEMKTQTPEIYRWVLESSRKTVAATLQDVLSRFGAGQNLDGDQVKASLSDLREREDDAAYKLVEEAAGPETMELAEWSLLNGPDDPPLDRTPQAFLSHADTIFRPVLEQLLHAWTAEWSAFRAWAGWMPTQGKMPIHTKLKYLAPPAARQAVKKHNEDLSTARTRAQEGASAHITWVVTDNSGAKRAVRRTARAAGDKGPSSREVPVNKEKVRVWSARALKSAPDTRRMAFYQLRDIVLIPGDNGGTELKELDMIRMYGTAGELQVIKAKHPKDPGKIRYKGAYDQAAFVNALRRITKKNLVPVEAFSDEVLPFGTYLEKEIQDMTHGVAAANKQDP
ncbi:hypothetical protein [Amycolatopsis sp. cmx-4-61]|uniref:hypothetical protein n=1 Tax=Amycolatopsis sp. cmx-4-61 TaxID=2790937 RepID=UPI003979A110